jgi:hypothetical protein
VAVYADRSDYEANQGDVFEGVPFTGFTSDGMVTAHDCVCDKFVAHRDKLDPATAAAWRVTMAPVHPLTDLTGDRQAAAKADQMPRYFYMPAEAGRPELVADLWMEQPVPFAALLDNCERVTSLSQEYLARLWQQWMRLRLGADYMDFLKELVGNEA